MEAEEFQEADVLWPWPEHTPSPSSSPGEDYSPASERYERDDAVVGFSCEPFSEPSLGSSASTLSALPFDPSSPGSSEDGFFLSGQSTVVSGIFPSSSEEFLEKDVLWPDDTADDDAAEFWCRRCCPRVEEAAASACGKREGWRLWASSSPIDIPVATGAAAARCRPSPSAMPLHRRW